MNTLHASNANKDIDGIMVQLPTPGVDDEELLSNIDPGKDVDCLHPSNLFQVASFDNGKTKQSSDSISFLPPCPAGMLELLIDHGVQLKDKRAVVIGSSTNLGLPVSVLLEREGAQVSILNINAGPKNMKQVLKEADILISAVGIGGIVQAEDLKDGVVIVDAGISFDENGKVLGDVAPESAKVASILSTVPGGVGPVTIATLLKNLVKNYKYRLEPSE